jgi:hypothetical protein
VFQSETKPNKEKPVDPYIIQNMPEDDQPVVFVELGLRVGEVFVCLASERADDEPIGYVLTLGREQQEAKVVAAFDPHVDLEMALELVLAIKGGEFVAATPEALAHMQELSEDDADQ